MIPTHTKTRSVEGHRRVAKKAAQQYRILVLVPNTNRTSDTKKHSIKTQLPSPQSLRIHIHNRNKEATNDDDDSQMCFLVLSLVSQQQRRRTPANLFHLDLPPRWSRHACGCSIECGNYSCNCNKGITTASGRDCCCRRSLDNHSGGGGCCCEAKQQQQHKTKQRQQEQQFLVGALQQQQQP